jgi:hypothetical protein
MNQMQPSSPFVSLPRELRDKIYSFLLIHDKAILASCPDCNHYLDGIHELYGCNECLTSSWIRPAKIPDLHVLLVNSQVHAEALEILYKGNTFEYKASRLEAMVHASGLKERLISAEDFTMLIQFLQSRTMLKKLHFTLVGSAWDREGLQEMLNNSRVTVTERISIKVEILEWDEREGPYPKWLSDFTQEDIAFCDFAKELGWSLVRQTAVWPEDGWWRETRGDNTRGLTQTGAQVSTWNTRSKNTEDGSKQ